MTALLQDKVIVVTGGGGGIGRSAAKVFARHGAKIIVTDRNEGTAHESAKLVRAEGGDARAFVADVTDEAQVQAMVGFALSAHGQLNGAFNNAGNANARAPTGELTADAWRATIDLVLTGVFLCIKHELPAMLAAGGGAIVSTASNSGIHGTPMLAPYGAAKAGVINLTKTIAVEYADRGIRANAICPGVIATPPIQAALDRGVDYSKVVRMPMGRTGQPDEVTELAAWLLSPLSGFVNGQAISIDGGQIASA
jgi:NAD(P)-dependent dehydrogenase (short-subunit alcohol dehydrogenase family)